jgi:ADP-ribose pyrophosphatase YjhB (NUDIX family)
MRWRDEDTLRSCIARRNQGNSGIGIDLGESAAQAAVRETLEESAIECEITGIVGIYSDPRHAILYTSNGEVRRELSIVLTERALSGRPTPSSESSEVRWVPAAEVPGYPMDRSMRVVNDAGTHAGCLWLPGAGGGFRACFRCLCGVRGGSGCCFRVRACWPGFMAGRGQRRGW